MVDPLSDNTKAILLLTAPLVAGRSRNEVKLLTASEYAKFAARLRQLQKQPADLFAKDAAEIHSACADLVEEARLEALLDRGFQLSQAVERWQSRAIWVVSRADAVYPRRLKAKLREESPAILYGCGDRELLDAGGLAVVGSRNVDEEILRQTEVIGRLAASASMPIVSGGARGIDQAAMKGALQAGGRALGILGCDLEKNSINRSQRNLILEQRLVIVSPYDPAARFNVGHAMQRNKLIYALADAALVMNAEIEKGGTWAGAKEQLTKYRLGSVYVRSTGRPSSGLDALIRIGASPWPRIESPEELRRLASGSQTQSISEKQHEFSFEPDSRGNQFTDRVNEDVSRTTESIAAETTARALNEQLFCAARECITALLEEPMREVEIAKALKLSPQQTKIWLADLVEAGALIKLKRPVRFARRD